MTGHSEPGAGLSVGGGPELLLHLLKLVNVTWLQQDPTGPVARRCQGDPRRHQGRDRKDSPPSWVPCGDGEAGDDCHPLRLTQAQAIASIAVSSQMLETKADDSIAAQIQCSCITVAG